MSAVLGDSTLLFRLACLLVGAGDLLLEPSVMPPKLDSSTGLSPPTNPPARRRPAPGGRPRPAGGGPIPVLAPTTKPAGRRSAGRRAIGRRSSRSAAAEAYRSCWFLAQAFQADRLQVARQARTQRAECDRLGVEDQSKRLHVRLAPKRRAAAQDLIEGRAQARRRRSAGPTSFLWPAACSGAM